MLAHCRWLAVAGFLTCLGLSWAADKEEEEVKLSKEEQILVDLANQTRKKEKLGVLKVNPLLNKAAVYYSGVMIKQPDKARKLMEKLDHAAHELDGKKIGDRLDDFKYDWTECGENVALAFSLDQMKKVHDSWMGSKYHRENILDKKFTEIGIAVVKHPDRKNEWYITQIFGTR
jgi:uncharacterized protein YkwD